MIRSLGRVLRPCATYIAFGLVTLGAMSVNGLAPSALGEVQPSTTITATRGIVVSDSAPASDVGAAVLRRGGNAVDAAVAMALALAVTLPEAGNLGGGGFMLVWPGEAGEPTCIDYRETAPAKATATMFSLGDSPRGHKVVGVPGTLRGLELAHRRFGKLPWKTLVEPAVRLADEGFVLGRRLAHDLNELLETSSEFTELRRVFGKAGATADWAADDRLRQPDLAATLRKIAEEGPSAFYTGAIARKIVAEMECGGGLITADDLSGYRAVERRPVRGTYRGYEILGAPPPSSGGIATIEALQMLESFELRQYDRGSARAQHLVIEVLRRAFCDRARWLGDPDFVEVPGMLLSEDYARQRAADIDLDRATPSDQLAPDIELAPEGSDTTHFSVIDADGMAVANTYTLEHSYGSRVVVRGAGFLLNNEMTDFNWHPGHTDRRGRIGTPPNTIAPGKRMLSSQSPTIVVRNGRPVLITGTPGGRTIISTVVCLLINTLEYEMPLCDAIDAPRLHHGWFPDVVLFEGTTDPTRADVVKGLTEMGHHIETKPHRQGSANSIWLDSASGLRHGVADRRRGGSAARE
ncbi:MAG TPA: gamma-glutamyltransferase [Pirellulales bacterium]|nr:gamma-glutamyltransferase [Pirellulales bacterium]